MIICGKAKFWSPYMDNDFNICFKYSNFGFDPDEIRADTGNGMIIVRIGNKFAGGRLKSKDIIKIQKFKNKILIDLKQSYKKLKNSNKVIIVDYGNTYMIFTKTMLDRGYLSIKYYNALVYYFQAEKEISVSNYGELCRKINRFLTKKYLKEKSKKYIKNIGYVIDIDDLAILLK